MLFAALLAVAAPVSVVFGGDAMFNGITPGKGALKALSSSFRSADVALVNLEIPLTNAKVPTSRKTAEELKRKDQFILKADPKHLGELKAAGIDMVSLANNHAMDYGTAGLRQMIGALDKAGIAHSGAGATAAGAERVAVVRRRGRRIGLVSYLAFVSAGALRNCTPATETSAGVAVLSFGGKPDTAKIAAIVERAKKSCDVLVVALHWGVERKTLPSAYQKALGHAFLDAGADVVWGHHPHVLQPVEIYAGKPLMYSMGNLVSPRPGEAALAAWVTGTDSVRLSPYRIRGGKAVLP